MDCLHQIRSLLGDDLGLFALHRPMSLVSAPQGTSRSDDLATARRNPRRRGWSHLSGPRPPARARGRTPRVVAGRSLPRVRAGRRRARAAGHGRAAGVSTRLLRRARAGSLRSSRSGRRGGVGAGAGVLGGGDGLAVERGEELPGGVRGELAAGAEGGAAVATVPGDERHWLRAAFEVGAGGLAAAGGDLLDVLLLAAVVGDEGVGQLDAAADGEDVVAHAVDAEVGDRVIAAVAAADQTAGDGGDGAEFTGASASDGVGHAAAVGETGGEAGALVDAKVGLDLLDDGVDKLDVGTALVGPAIVDAVRGDEDGRSLGESIKAVPRLHAVAVHDIAHGTTEPVEAKDKAIRLAGVIAVGDLQGVLTVVDVLHAGSECGLTIAAAG